MPIRTHASNRGSRVLPFLLAAVLSSLGGCGGLDGIAPAEGPPARLEWRSGAIATGFANNVFAPPELRVLNAEGQPLEGVSVEFRLEGEGRLAWSKAMTSSDGYASAGGWRLGAFPGVQRLVAQVGELSLSWVVTVTDPPPSAFAFQSSYEAGVSFGPGAQTSIAKAFVRWQSLVIGDLPDVVLPGSLEPACPVPPVEPGFVIDDLFVIIGTNPGPGRVAATTICARRPGSGLPLVVSIRVDVSSAAAEGIETVMEHELAHALGFGTAWFGANLVDDDDDPRFIGAHAVAAYCLAIGSPCKRGVPVEAGSIQGVARAHWREGELGSELLTPFFDSPWQPLSAITIGVLRDLGHVVDDSKADAFPL